MPLQAYAGWACSESANRLPSCEASAVLAISCRPSSVLACASPVGGRGGQRRGCTGGRGTAEEERGGAVCVSDGATIRQQTPPFHAQILTHRDRAVDNFDKVLDKLSPAFRVVPVCNRTDLSSFSFVFFFLIELHRLTGSGNCPRNSNTPLQLCRARKTPSPATCNPGRGLCRCGAGSRGRPFRPRSRFDPWPGTSRVPAPDHLHRQGS